MDGIGRGQDTLATRARTWLGVLGLCLAAGQVAGEAPADLEAVDLEPVEAEPVEAGTYGPTTPNDTLWSIARQVRPDGLTVVETVSALQRMNPHAFLGGDPNRLMRGVVLKVPTAAAGTERPAAGEKTPEPAPLPREAPAPEPEETILEEPVPVPDFRSPTTMATPRETVPAKPVPVPVAGVEDPGQLVLRNAELEERLEAVRTELDVATAKNEALEAQISTMRRRIAEGERQLADARSLAENDVEATGWNSVTGLALAALLVAVIAFLYMRLRGGREGAAAKPSPQPLGARRIAARRLAPDVASNEYASSTKLNLARALVDMGRTEQAREVLEEVRAEGSDTERREAEELLGRMK